MIDGIKICIMRSDVPDLRTVLADRMEFFKTNPITGEEVKIKGTVDGLDITFTPQVVLISGSLHKYFNNRKQNGWQNYNDFYYEDLQWAINDLQCRFGFLAERARIQRIEFGVNIDIGKSPTEFLAQNVICHKWKGRNRTEEFDGKGYFTSYKHSQYVMKIYDKGRQYELDKESLRVEVNVLKMAEIKNTGIKTLDDLLDKRKLVKLKRRLVKRAKDFLVVDDFKIKDFPAETIKQLLEKTNAQYWNSLARTNYSNTTKYRRKKGFLYLLECEGLDTLKNRFVERVNDKFGVLLNGEKVDNSDYYIKSKSVPFSKHRVADSELVF